MLRILLLMICLSAASLFAQPGGIPINTQSADEWSLYRSPEGRFQIATPGAFKKTSLHSTTAIGEVDVHFLTYPVEPISGEPFYIVNFYTFPPETVHSDSLELLDSFFVQTIQTATEGLPGAKVVYETEAELYGFPGRIWKVDDGERSRQVRCRAYLMERTFFMLMVLMPNEADDLDAVNRYFDSFRVLKYGS